MGNPALESRVAETNDPELVQALTWSVAVNRTIADMVRGVPPFPFVRESLRAAARSGRPARLFGDAAGGLAGRVGGTPD